ncbi:uncharacterized protein LOC131875150 [Cryptomeria japonica]|uniref:uncharacterized protein LOC131875150 n=1 Tax=Cryptomeria japonica TaxID=3369 RepID=UPI0027DAB18B|nr:uncharacterized protein LOC131875150 [Cryptomeria japonica]
MCLLKDEGGARLRKMELQNRALGAKLTWKMYEHPNKLWCRIFRKKYLDMDNPNRILTIADATGGSSTWNFLWDSRSIITDHLSWHIGNGQMAKFWRDSWEGEQVLGDLFAKQDWVNEVESKISLFVKDYVDDSSDIGGRLGWKSIDIGDSRLCLKLTELLKNRCITQSEQEDTIFWCASKSGKYSVKLAYEIQRQRVRDSSWPYYLYWNNIGLPKAGAFLWIALHGKILTSDRLKLIGIVGPSWCIMCKRNEESANYLLLRCPFAEGCWEWLMNKLQFTSVRNESLKDFLVAWPKNTQSKWSGLWRISPALLSWHIWKERNRRIFREIALSVEEVISKIKEGIEEVINGKPPKVKPLRYDNWDRDMESNWTLKDWGWGSSLLPILIGS